MAGGVFLLMVFNMRCASSPALSRSSSQKHIFLGRREPSRVSVRHTNLRSTPSIRVKLSPEASAAYKGTVLSGRESVSVALLAQADTANNKQIKITACFNTSVQVIQRTVFDSVRHSIHPRRLLSHIRWFPFSPWPQFRAGASRNVTESRFFAN